MKILNWNIRHGGAERASDIMKAILAKEPDVVVLTEFRADDSGAYIQKALAKAGLACQKVGLSKRKANSVLVASREQCKFRTLSDTLDFSEQRWVVAELEGFDLYATYFPQRELKRAHFEAFVLEQAALKAREREGMLIGDLNTGSHEIDEEAKTFHWPALFEGLVAGEWIDAWRSRNAEAREYTSFNPQGDGFRIDHCLVSGGLDERVKSVGYGHGVREKKISDHSMMVVEIGS